MGWRSQAGIFGHEPALVSCCCYPAELLGSSNLVGTPWCSDARRYHPCGWHSQGGPPAMASCRTSEQLRWVGDRNDPTTERLGRGIRFNEHIEGDGATFATPESSLQMPRAAPGEAVQRAADAHSGQGRGERGGASPKPAPAR